MKKVIVITVFVISVILLSSCVQNTGTQLSRLDELKLQYDQVGFQHNLKLDEMLTEFKTQTETRTLQTCQKLVDNYFSGSGDLAKNIVNKITDKVRLGKSTQGADIIDILADSLDIFVKYRAVFDSISVISDSHLDVRDKINKLEGIYLYVDDTIEDPNDKESVLNGLSTIIHSMTYWNENYDEWQQVLNGSIGKSTIGIVGIIGITDGVGAVIGTLEGIRDTYKGQEGRGRIILGRAVGEAAKTSVYAAIAILL